MAPLPRQDRLLLCQQETPQSPQADPIPQAHYTVPQATSTGRLTTTLALRLTLTLTDTPASTNMSITTNSSVARARLPSSLPPSGLATVGGTPVCGHHCR